MTKQELTEQDRRKALAGLEHLYGMIDYRGSRNPREVDAYTAAKTFIDAVKIEKKSK